MAHDHDIHDDDSLLPPRIGDESWSIVRLCTPMWLEEPMPVRLDAFVVFGHDGDVLAQLVLDPSEPASRAKDALEQALRNPMQGKVRKPTEVRVEDSELIPHVKAALAGRAPNAAITEVAWLEEADALFAAMRDKISGKVPRQTFAGTGASQTLIADFFAAMAALDAQKPWERAHEEQPVGLTIASLGIEGAAVTVLGDDSEGLMVQEGDDYTAFEDISRGEASERDVFDHGLITAQFGALLRAGTEMIVELREGGFAKDEARVPLPHVLGTDACPRPLMVRDLIVLTAAAKALARLFERDGDVFDPSSEREITIEDDFPVGDETLHIRVDAPHRRYQWTEGRGSQDDPARPYLPPGDEEQDDALLEEEDLLDEERRLSNVELALREAFLAAHKDKGVEWRVRAERVITELFDYTRASEAKFGDWTMGELERFVLDDLPEHAGEDRTVALAPEVIVELAKWLQQERVPRIDVPAIEKRMRKVKPRLDELLAARHSNLLA
jgi:hypothetical protein